MNTKNADGFIRLDISEYQNKHEVIILLAFAGFIYNKNVYILLEIKDKWFEFKRG